MSARLPALDWRTLPLEGRVLVEASAGTGKTWSIAQLYLRLLLEQGREIGEILVCTFTEAAADELRQRLRARLVEAEALLSPPTHADSAANDDGVADDGGLAAWLSGLATGDDARRRLLARLRAARLDFDRAPVRTLHGFAARALREHPFDSGAGFAELELVDHKALLREAFDDARRAALQAEPASRPPWAAELAARGSQWLGPLQRLLQHPGAPLRAPPAEALDALEDRVAWLAEPASIAWMQLLFEDAQGRCAWSAKSKFRRQLGELADALADGTPPGMLDPKALDAITPEGFARGTNKGCSLAPEDPELAPLYQAVAALAGRQRLLRARLLAEVAEAVQQRMQRRARERGLRTFDAMIGELLAALEGPGGERFATALHAAHPVALIDECQDTDPRQYRILDAIYRGRGGLLLIGDPKQAIYAFRGGDVAAYLVAARDAGERRWSMATNFRSAGRLVGALNRLYARSTDPFLHEDIGYREVAASGRADARPYLVDGEPVAAPLLIHADVDPTTLEPAIEGTRTQRAELAILACANAIAALLDAPGHAIDGRPIEPGDIAVLLKSNAQIDRLREALARRGVPVVGPGRSSVYAGETCEALLVVMHAILHPGDEGALRAALATVLLGADLRALRALDAEPARWDAQAQRFEGWRRLWQERGVLALVAAIEAEEAGNLLAGAAGERRLTDLRQLGELMAAGAEGESGPSAQVERLRRARSDALSLDDKPDDARQLRLESEGRRVRLLTVHAAKGLEFPIVFLPLAWNDGRRRGGVEPPAVFHDGDLLVRDVGSEAFDQAATEQEREEDQERRRVLYVALTRAVHACHVFWSPDGAEANALDALLAPGADDAAARARAVLALGEAVDGVAVQPGWPMDRQGLAPRPAAAGERRAREDLPAPRMPWRIHSFTALTHRARGEGFDPGLADDEREIDMALAELVAPPPDAEAGRDDAPDPAIEALAQLRGPRFGNAVHAVFELAEPGVAVADTPELVVQALRDQGLAAAARDRALVAAIAAMVDRNRAAVLPGDTSLRGLAAADAVPEFEFHLALGGGRLEALRRVAAEHELPGLVPAGLGHGALHGLMTGKVDLVFAAGGRFHVLDYKSNWLGPRRADYAPAALARAMDAAAYPLQAAIYTVALHRYLARRVPDYAPERHLGESLYLFVRAFGLDGDCGLWRHRFTPGLVRDLDAVLAGEPAGHAA